MGVLDGFRILDFTQHQAGPYGGALLADFGADVVKIERPGGDPGRTNHPTVNGLEAFFLTNNRGKRSLCLDLTQPEAVAVIQRLLGDTDALIHNLKPGAMEKLGLGYEQLRNAHPRLVYAAVSTFGPNGPRKDMTGVDLVAQAESGLMSVTGLPDGDALPVGSALADALGGINLAFATVAALLDRERTGRGQRVDVSLVGGLLGVQAWEMQHFLLSREQPPRAGRSHPLIKTLWQSFRAKDGAFVLAEVSNSWDGICRAIGRPELARDERFTKVGRRLRNRSELIAILDEAFARSTVQDWVARLRAESVLAAPVQTYASLATDADVLANGYVQTITVPGKGQIQGPGPFLHFSEAPAEIRGAGPLQPGADSDEILSESGLSGSEIADLRARGVLG